MSRKKFIPVGFIQRKIYPVRGYRVMLDRDLAELYGVQTRILNQAVKRNIERFPPHFMLSLTRDEIERISQFVISLKFSKNVQAFTEQGVAMLSSVLHSDWAIQVNIAIMDAFVQLRETLASNKELSHKLTELERKIGKHDEHIRSLFDAIRQLMTPPQKSKRLIGFHVYKNRCDKERLKARSRRLAERIVKISSGNMAMELQKPDKKPRAREIKRLQKEILKKHRSAFDQHDKKIN